jgi:dTDP-4-amino-4,6-dideoxygalactose transaminase
MSNWIPFNKPFLTGNEMQYMEAAVVSGKISGDGMYTKKCSEWLEARYGFKKVLLTTSCTDALELAALLIDIQPGDEVIAPSYTFVSTVNAFVLRGAKIIFIDSVEGHPNMDVTAIEKLITKKTKAIIPVHYGGVACPMDEIMELANRYQLVVIEDAAQAVDSFYKDRPLGSIGHLAAFSFHETKNVICGEGGMLVINDESYIQQAEIIREKGTNRSQFFRGQVDKYNWVSVGSSFLPSDLLAAFLFAQLEHLDAIQTKRKLVWNTYMQALESLSTKVQLPYLPDYATNNGHLFYIVCANTEERAALIGYLKAAEINAVFHYQSLHSSPFYSSKHDGRTLPHCERYSDCLLRLPFYYELPLETIEFICEQIQLFYSTIL